MLFDVFFMFFNVVDVFWTYVLAGRRLGHIDTTFTRRVVVPCDVPVKECGCFAPHTEGRSPPHASTTPTDGRAGGGSPTRRSAEESLCTAPHAMI